MRKERIANELKLLHSRFPHLQTSDQNGLWVLLPDYVLPKRVWVQDNHSVCFKIPLAYPGQAPYAFYVNPHPRLHSGGQINNYTSNVTEPPFPGEWGKFSWSIPGWRPADIQSGCNLLNFVLSFQKRLEQGA